MTQYYQISETGYPIISPIMLDGFTAYEVGKEPKVLRDALAVEALKDAKQKAAQIISSDYQKAIQAMTGSVDAAEMASWTKQETEARAWTVDNNAITPIIDNLIIGRAMGESKADLVAKIIAKADGYAIAYAQVLGQYHAKQKALEACTTVEAVIAL